MTHLLTAAGAALILAVPNSVVEQLVASRRIPVVRLPLVDSVRFDVSDLEQWVERHKQAEREQAGGGGDR